MVAWLENDRPVDHIISTKYRNDNASAGISFTRKLCPVSIVRCAGVDSSLTQYFLLQYPQQAVYQGGDQNTEASFACK